MRKLLSLLLCAAMLFSLSAVLAEEKKPYDGESIRIIFGNHDWTDATKDLVAEFTEKTGIKVVAESYPEDQLNQKVTVELLSGGKNLDVFMTRPLQETKMFINNGWLMDISALAEDAEFDMADFIPSALEIFQKDGITYGIPLVTERQVMFYRKDLLDAAGIEVPTTFEELEAAAAALHKPDEGVYGFVSRGLSAAAVTQFSSFLRGFGGDFDVDGKATLDTPEAIEAFDYYGRMLRNYGPPGVLNMHWQQAAGVYSQGQAAFCTDADAIWKSFSGPDTLVYETTGYAPIPGGKPYNICSWGLSVPAGSQKAGPAMEFIKWATSKEMIAFAQGKGISSSRQSVWNDPDSTKNYPPDLTAAIAASNPIGVASDRPLVKDVGKARDIIGSVIVTAIEGGDIEAAAKEANAAYQVIIDEDRSAK